MVFQEFLSTFGRVKFYCVRSCNPTVAIRLTLLTNVIARLMANVIPRLMVNNLKKK